MAPRPARLTMGEAAEAHMIPPGGYVVELNGVTVTIPNPGATDIPMTMQALYDALDATVTANPGVDWTFDWIWPPDAPNTGIVIASDATGSTASLEFTQGGAPLPWPIRGAFGLSGRSDTGADGSGVTAPAMLTGMSAPINLTTPLSFDVNGESVTLAAGTHAPQDVAGAINAVAIGVTASVVSGALTLTTDVAGAAETVTIDNFVPGYPALLGFGPPAVPGATIAVDGQSSARDSITIIDDALDRVSRLRADIGALQSRFGFHQAAIATCVENLTMAISAIRDTDIAQEAAKLASSKVKTQAAVAAAAQASQMPQDLLRLLQ